MPELRLHYNEDTSHVVRCPSPGRTTFYNEPDEDLSLHNIRCMLDAIDYTTAASRGRLSVTVGRKVADLPIIGRSSALNGR
mmetsp:Transcript_28153/g.47764  ORF Transcript_28153/g.47764 Transcript_28153/m.47764 type:complete len:81 (+) Transcript_28153:4231-4473(+)